MRCSGLTSLPVSVGNLGALIELDLEGGSGPTSLPESLWIEELVKSTGKLRP